MLLSALVISVATAQSIPAGATIDRAVSVQVTREGLDNFADVIPALVPPTFPIDTIQSSGGTGNGCFSYEVRLSNLIAGIEVEDVTFSPRTGILDLKVDMMVNMNNSGNPFDLFYNICSDNDCEGWIRPFLVKATVPFQLAVVAGPDGRNTIDATIGTIAIDNRLAGTDIELTNDCDIIDTFNTIGSLFGFSFYDFVITNINPFLQSAIQDQAQDFEATIEDALSAARFEDTVSLGSAELSVLVEPRDIDISPYGLEIDLLGRIDSPAAECIAAMDPGSSPLTPSNVPYIDENVAGTQAIVHLADDFANQGMYGVWRSGILCYEIGGDSDIDLGIPINGSLLGIIGGEGFTKLLPENAPLTIKTNPRLAPTVVYDGGYDLTALVRGLDVNFYTDIDGRKARALGITVDADAGVDLLFDGTTGVLAADVALGPDNINPIASHNELVAGSSAEIEANFIGLVDVLLDSLVGNTLDGIAFGLPAYEGIGLASASAAPTGDGDWLGVSATVGRVTYTGGDCGDGCSGGTTGGCSSAAGGLGALFVVLPLVMVRRRRT